MGKGNKRIHSKYTSFFSLLVLFIILISFITYELIYDYDTVASILYKIFSLYLIIYVIMKIIAYCYKITFQISEEYYVHIDNLKKDDIVDLKYLQTTFNSVNLEEPETLERYKKNL